MTASLRLLLAGLAGGLAVAAGLVFSMSQVFYVNYPACTPSSDDPRYPLSALVYVDALSPVTVRVHATGLLGPEHVRVVVEGPEGRVELEPGGVYEARLAPGERLTVRVYCFILGLGDADIPMAMVSVHYMDLLSLLVAAALLASLVGVAVVGRV